MSTTSQFFSGGSSIKSIQRGVISITSGTSATASITSVDTSKTELRCLGGDGLDASGFNNMARIVLTNATTITATVGRTAAGTGTQVSWELTEYN